ncbi:MAG: TetR/AcrR family transcriptional regulator [Acutalibacteraceae bacterium]
MPRTLSDEEREHIRRRLREEAMNCMRQYGVKKTTVDELVRRVNIPKGTFYLFYKSKELALFDALQEIDKAMHDEMTAQATTMISGIDADKLTDFIMTFYRKGDELGIFEIISGGGLEILFRKLPRDLVEQHLNEDQGGIAQMLGALGIIVKDEALVSAAFHGIFYEMSHKAEMGDSFWDVIRAQVRGLVIQIMNGEI